MIRMPIAVALMRNRSGQVLLVRKRGTLAFMQPGGKIEAGEDACVALARELREELCVSAPQGRLRYLGCADAPAAHEPGVTVAAEIFELHWEDEVRVQAEIEEAVWVDPAAAVGGLALAPLTRDHILPMAVALQP